MTSKLSFLTSVAAGALALGMAAAPASAFDKVNWEWNLVLTETITKDIDIDVYADPSGMVLLENLQVQVGDVRATSIVDGIYNNQYLPNGTNGTVNFTVDFTDPYQSNQPGQVDPHDYSGTATLGGDLAGTGTIVGQVHEGNNRVDGIATFENVVIDIPPTASFDAMTELPEVVSAATAVGNNSSIDSEVMVEVHEGQFLFDTADGGLGLGGAIGALAIYGLFDAGYGNVNTHHLVGAATLVGAVSGLIDKAEISAVSKVSNILNATVDSSATAVGNNKSITIEPRTWADSIMIGDVTQVSVANVSALSEVRNVSLNSYTNLGALDRPIVNSVATAVGNNLSVSVKAPD